MFFTCGLNEAMVVSGFCRSPPVMVPGGRVFVFPCIQQIRRIFLNTLTLNVKSEKIYTRHGVPISVTGIAQEDRQKFSEQVFKVASSGLVNMGISVAQTAQVQKDARIGEAEAKRDAGIREAKAKQEKVSAQSLSEIEMAKTQRDYELTKATHDIEVSTYQAQADLACQLQMQIEEQRVQVQVVEQAQQVAVQEQEIAWREKELEASVRKPRYKLDCLAEAEKSQLIMQAEAEAESVGMRGEAEAFAIGARARAEAEQMAKKVEAFQLYQEAAQLDMLLEKLPQVAEEICGPLISANKITLVSIGSGTMGAATVTGEVLDILSNLPESVERLTGVSISPVNHKPLQTA
uniref:Flotillin n=1 Tax=Saimiri boliviensis boliviensis TaxID=39432 RepID=A0A2K6SZY9_SAIBB